MGSPVLKARMDKNKINQNSFKNSDRLKIEMDKNFF